VTPVPQIPAHAAYVKKATGCALRHVTASIYLLIKLLPDVPEG
jgi:hypothetical protein